MLWVDRCGEKTFIEEASSCGGSGRNYGNCGNDGSLRSYGSARSLRS